MTTTTTTTVTAEGRGPLTAGALRALLSDAVLFPDDVRLEVRTSDDQRDGQNWAVTARVTTRHA